MNSEIKFFTIHAVNNILINSHCDKTNELYANIFMLAAFYEDINPMRGSLRAFADA